MKRQCFAIVTFNLTGIVPTTRKKCSPPNSAITNDRRRLVDSQHGLFRVLDLTNDRFSAAIEENRRLKGNRSTEGEKGVGKGREKEHVFEEAC